MKYLFILSIAMAAFACTSEAEAQAESTGAIYKVVTQDEFKEKMGLENIQLIDVRTPEEVAEGKIDGSTNINVFDEDFKDQVAQLDKTKTTLIYCRSGARSAKASKIMLDLGFEEIYDLKGGYSAW